MKTRQEINKEIIEKLIVDLTNINPEIEIVRTKYTEKIVYYTPHVHDGKIKISKNDRNLYIKDDATKLARNRYFTKQQAKNAILEVMEQADSKARVIAEKLVELENQFDFYIDYTMEGDTYGIYEDYLNINFELNNFSFNYNVRDLMEFVDKK